MIKEERKLIPEDKSKFYYYVSTILIKRLKEEIPEYTERIMNDPIKGEENKSNRLKSLLKTEEDKKEFYLKAYTKCMELFYYIENRYRFFKDNNDFVNIHKKDLSQFYVYFNYKKPFFYNDLITILHNIQAIVINDKYSTGKENTDSFSKSYKVDERIYGGDLEKIELSKKLLGKLNYKTKSQLIRENPNYRIFIENIGNIAIDINSLLEEALFRVGETIDIRTKKVRAGNKFFRLNKKRKMDTDKISRMLNQSTLINYGYFYFVISNEGRIYSSMTNLDSIARNHIYYIKDPNRDLSGADGKQMQPSLLDPFLNDPIYTEHIINNTLYDKLGKILNKNRNQIKVLLYEYVFFNNNQLGKTGKLSKAMESIIPGVLDKINKIKEEKELYSILQTLESNIFIDTFMEEDNFFITIHDQIICFREDIEYFQNKLLDKFKEHNIKTTLSIEESFDIRKNIFDIVKESKQKQKDLSILNNKPIVNTFLENKDNQLEDNLDTLNDFEENDINKEKLKKYVLFLEQSILDNKDRYFKSYQKCIRKDKDNTVLMNGPNQKSLYGEWQLIRDKLYQSLYDKRIEPEEITFSNILNTIKEIKINN